jgi:hypothetical protein
MHDFERFRLRFGPYRTPRLRYGATVKDARRGYVKIVGLSDAPIPWPLGQWRAGKSPVLYGALLRAVRRESNQAVARARGVSMQTVSLWRKALGVGPMTEGTSKLREAYAFEPGVERGRRNAWAKARDSERRAKIAAARRGKPRPPHVTEAMRQGRTGKPHSVEARRKMSEAHKRRGTRPPNGTRLWTAEEDAIVAKLPAAEAAKRTGRTLIAVFSRRLKLGLPDGRRRATTP